MYCFWNSTEFSDIQSSPFNSSPLSSANEQTESLGEYVDFEIWLRGQEIQSLGDKVKFAAKDNLLWPTCP